MTKVPERSLMRVPEVIEKVGCGDRPGLNTVRRADPTFPKPRGVGKRMIYWIREEIDAWIDSLPVKGTNKPKTA